MTFKFTDYNEFSSIFIGSTKSVTFENVTFNIRYNSYTENMNIFKLDGDREKVLLNNCEIKTNIKKKKNIPNPSEVNVDVWSLNSNNNIYK